jgi:hypothetical protein
MKDPPIQRRRETAVLCLCTFSVSRWLRTRRVRVDDLRHTPDVFFDKAKIIEAFAEAHKIGNYISLSKLS